MGITQHSHGTDNVLALGNLALLTGNVGVRGGGVNPLRGQNNVQGACDMAALPNVYPGYQQVADAKVKEKFEKAWGVSGLSAEPGLPMLKMMQAIDEGKIKALYLIGENPAMSEPDIKHVKETLKKLELFVAQDLFQTESTPDAHVILPAQATMEKDGTFTNTERRVQPLNKVVEPVGDSKPDWWITSEIAKRMGAKGFGFSSAADVLKEINKVTPSYAGITPARLKAGDQLHWPCPAEDHPGTPILHTKTFTRGKGYLAPIDYKGAAELPDDEYPFVLTTDRSLFQFHTSTMSGRSKGLCEMWGEQRVRISPATAKDLGVADGDMVKVTSRRGEAKAKAMVTPRMADKVVAMDFHFAEANANLLTNPTCDPVANIPELKACAIRIEKA
jgi:predicted molibdopterin-dependent oxidoreductase YjgC